MADVMEKYSSEPCVEFVENSVVPNAIQADPVIVYGENPPASCPFRQPCVAPPHEYRAASYRKPLKMYATRFGARQPQLFWRTSGAATFGDFSPRLIEFGLYFIS